MTIQCKFLKEENNTFICKMSGRKIEKDTYSCFCATDDLSLCTVYQYYLQKYEEISSK